MSRLVRAELVKLRTTRPVYGLAAVMAIFAVLTVAANITSAGRQGTPALSAASLPMLATAPATLLSSVVLLLAILGTAGEFRHQTITQAFLVTPNRGRVVTAKLAAYGLTLAIVVTRFTIRRDIT